VQTQGDLFGANLCVPCSLRAKQSSAKWEKNKSPLGARPVRKCAARKKAFHKNIPPATRFDHLSLSNLVLDRPRELERERSCEAKVKASTLRAAARSKNASQQAPRAGEKTFREMCMGLSAALLFGCKSSSA